MSVIIPTRPNPYESGIFLNAADKVFRPGGLLLTKLLADTCAFQHGAKVIDIGCGTGITIEFLRDQYKLDAAGIDTSSVLLSQGIERSPELRLIRANGEGLPFADSSVNGVIAECSLSVMAYSDKVFGEIIRILAPRGKLAISDIYFRERDGAIALREMPCAECISGALTYPELMKKLHGNGFTVLAWEDHSGFLKEFIARFIMKHGSIDGFWQGTPTSKEDELNIQSAIKNARPGYFWLCAEKSAI